MRHPAWNISLACAALTLAGLMTFDARPARACALTPQHAMPGVTEWLRKAEAASHPLVGRVYADGALLPDDTGRMCDAPALFRIVGNLADRLQGADPAFVLIGEVHDNPWHHALRAEVLRRLRSLATGEATSEAITGAGVVFEHIRADQQAGLALFNEMRRNGQHLDSVAEFFRFLKWDQSGWPDKKLFQPLFRAAIEGRHPILAGDPPRDTVRAVARQGLAPLPPEDVRRLRLEAPLPLPLQDALLGELEASHCGLVPRAHFTNMAVAQRYRDAHLAEAVLKAAEKHGAALLLAGNGHVRSDRGVPHALRQMAPGKKIISVLLLEVEDGKTDPGAYVPRDPQGRPAADSIVFTPRAERKDPCIELRERFGRKN